ncbi:MAG: fibro-slime domain-containing protein [Leptolyngbya sp. PLA1]|nr:fibro-slime domain-containing protein [Leptolyngbya sp. PLA1]
MDQVNQPEQSRKPSFGSSLVRVLVLGALVAIPVTVAVKRTFVGRATAGPNPSAPTYTLWGVFRDFRADNVRNGHPDMQMTPSSGRGVYEQIAADVLNAEGDPVFSTTGFKASALSQDSSGRPIIGRKAHLTEKSGDRAGARASTAGGAVQSAESFSSWFKDVAGVNQSAGFPIALAHSNGVWSIDTDLLTQRASVPGFGGNKVYSYTFELETTFGHDPAQERYVKAGADDCLWVYINGQLVIDLGGSHDFAEQYFDLSRLQGVEAGQTCTLKVFYAERNKGASRFKFETNIPLNPVDLPSVSGLHD